MWAATHVHCSSEQSLAFNNIRQPLLFKHRVPGGVDQPVWLHHEEHLHWQSLGFDFGDAHSEVDASRALDRPLRVRGTKPGPVVVESIIILLGGVDKVKTVKPAGLNLPSLNVFPNLLFPHVHCEVFASNPASLNATVAFLLLCDCVAVSLQQGFYKKSRFSCITQLLLHLVGRQVGADGFN